MYHVVHVANGAVRQHLAVPERVREVDAIVNVVMPGLVALAQKWFSDAVVENWRGGVKLIPQDWPTRRADEE